MRLRPARGEDALIIFEWVMDYETRRNATNSKSFSFDSHCQWLKEKLADANTHIYIAEFNDHKFGQLRLKINDLEIFVSIVVNPEYRRKGYGRRILDAGLQSVAANELELASGNWKMVAIIMADNSRSIRLFKNQGFVQTEETSVYKRRVFLRFERDLIL